MDLTNDELYDVFAEWNKGELDSYLIEITRDIFSVKDPDTGNYLVDMILDTAGAKGTGKWMSQLALDLGVPSTLVTEAVYARVLSALKEERVRASKVLHGPAGRYEADRQSSSSKPCGRPSTPRRFAATPRASCSCKRPPRNTNGRFDYGSIALLWRGGCIIRAAFLERIKEAFDADKNLENLLLAPYFREVLEKAQPAWRHAVTTAVQLGIWTPAFTTALSYYDGIRQDRLPANLLQAQRDYFGAHTYQRDRQTGHVPHRWLQLRRQPK